MYVKRRSKPDDLEASHTPEAIRARLGGGVDHSYLRDFIYGAIDGSVTTFAVVSGVAGAGLSPGVIIIMGLANLVGDGFSMAASNFLGTRAEGEERERARHEEERHIANIPEGEREEIRQIFAAKGFEGDLLESAVRIITADQGQWVDTMIREELGLSLETRSAFRAAFATFAAFIILGSIPLLPFIWLWMNPAPPGPAFVASTVLTGAAMFGAGAFKSLFVRQSWWSAGMETAVVGGMAAGLAYLVGVALKVMGFTA